MAEYQFENTLIGKRYDGNPLPYVEEVTTIYPAGPLNFGVEGRALFDEGQDAPWAGGPTLHVFDAQTGEEYLRFDAFPGFEHYHYLHPDRSNHVVGFDTAANGDFLAWIIDRVQGRLPDLLRQTAGAHLADRLDPETLRQTLVPVEQHLRSAELQLDAGR